MKWNPDISSRVKNLFHEWDCSRLNNEQLVRDIRSLGLHVSQGLMDTLEHHRLTRNMSYIEFVRALMTEDTSRTVSSSQSLSDPQLSHRIMNAVIFKDIPVVSSAKAPFGTDNNLYIKQNEQTDLEMDKLTSAVIASGISTPNRSLGIVPGARDVFKESDGQTNPVYKQETPVHMKSSINPVTGEGNTPPKPDPHKQCAHRKSNLIVGDHFDDKSNSNKIFQTSKKHFDDKSTYKISDWSVAIHAVEHKVPQSTGSDIISHYTDRPPLPYRPITKAGSARKPDFCPFATDADDLKDMRRRIMMNPLGRISAPEPISQEAVGRILQ